MKDLKKCTRQIRTRDPMIISPTRTTMPAIAAAEITANLCYLCTNLINVYCS